jgi:deglycase
MAITVMKDSIDEGVYCEPGDIVRGKNVTGYFSIKDDLVDAGALWRDEEVVQDGNIITSRKPSDLSAFCKTIITAIGGKR